MTAIQETDVQKIVSEIQAGRFSYSDHANLRSLERSLPVSEIIYISHHLRSWAWQEDKKTYLFIGDRLNGKAGGFSAVNRDGVIIITVFKRSLKKWEKANG
ncbi:MAG: hypothetical protein ABIQ95_13880 [Bdellovibrionia bacterium]